MLIASIVFAVLVFLMTGTRGLFTPTLMLKAYFENAAGLRVGAPVRLEGVDIGNVSKIAVAASRPLSPVEVTMKVANKYPLRKDSVATLSTAGVLGETFVDISNKTAKGPEVQNWDALKTEGQPAIQDVIRASNGTGSCFRAAWSITSEAAAMRPSTDSGSSLAAVPLWP